MDKTNSNLIEATFAGLKRTGRKALIGYVTGGFPSKKAFPEVVARMQRAGVDILEVGVPFSDPVADGVTIQQASQKALQNGVTLEWILKTLSVLHNIHMPVILMAYSNSILSMGLDSFFARARKSRVSGVIIPDLIPEEGRDFERAAAEHHIALTYLAAPTTTPERLKRIASATRGFLYAVSLLGITGARTSLAVDLPDFLRRIRRVTDKPVALGFGISTPEQVREVRKNVDGIIVGSALITHLEKSVHSAETFVASLQKALNPKEISHAS